MNGYEHMLDFTELEKRQIEAIKAVLMIASSNFPDNTDVELRVEGKNIASISVPYFLLIKLFGEKL